MTKKNMILESLFPGIGNMPKAFETVELISYDGIARLMNTRSRQSQSLMRLLEKLECTDEGLYYTTLTWRRSSKTPNHGRYYAPGAMILQRRIDRGALYLGDWVEIDIRSSNPCILTNLAYRIGLRTEYLMMYAQDVKGSLRLIRSEFPDDFWASCSDDNEQFTPKYIVNCLVMGSRKIWELIEGNTLPGSFIQGLAKDMNSCRAYVFEHFTDVPYNNDSYLQSSSRLTNTLLTIESFIVYRVFDALRSRHHLQTVNDIPVIGLAHDGLFVPAPCADIALDISREILADLRLFDVCMIAKEIIPDYTDVVEISMSEIRVPPIFTIRFKTLLIDFPTGSGKTYQVMRYALSANHPVLYIVHRQALAMDLAQKYPQFVSYLDTTRADRFDGHFQIICVNSLDKLKNPGKYKTVIVDEVSSLLDQCVDMEISVMSIAILEKYFNLQSVKLIAMDANLHEMDRALLDSPYGTVSLSPVSMRPPDRHCVICPSETYAFANLADDITNGACVAIAHSYPISFIDQLLESLGGRYWHVNRYTKKEFPISRWEEADVVAFTPTMDAGVDVSFYDEDGVSYSYFDRVYGFFNAHNSGPRSIIQMLGRIRDCNDFVIYVKPASKPDLKFCSRVEFKEQLKKRVTLLSNLRINCDLDDNFNAIIREDIRFELAWRFICMERETASDFFNVKLRRYLIRNNYKFTCVGLAHMDPMMGQFLSEVKEHANIQFVEDVAKAPLPTSDDLASFKKKDFTRPEFLMYLGHRIMEAFGFDCIWSEHVDERLAQKEADLYCFDENGNKVKFDYVSFYRRNGHILSRMKQFMRIDRGDPPRLVFNMRDVTFTERTYMVKVILARLGFMRLDDVCREVNWDALKLPWIRKFLSGRKFKNVLRKLTGLEIHELNPNEHVLASSYFSKTPGSIYFYISDLPVVSLAVSCVFERDKGKYRCTECFSLLMESSIRKHSCRKLPPGMIYELVDGKQVKRCTVCGDLVFSNVKRHVDIHNRMRHL